MGPAARTPGSKSVVRGPRSEAKGPDDGSRRFLWACPMAADAKKLANEPTASSLLHIRSVNDSPVPNAADCCCKTHGYS